MSAAAATAQAHPQRRHRHRFLSAIQLLVYRLFFAHLGKFIVVAVYYILLETMRGQHTTIFHWAITLPDVKGTWDQLLSRAPNQGGLVRLMKQDAWDSMRHVVFRGLIEGVLGVVLFKQIGFNIEKYRAKLRKEPNRVDRLILRSRIFASPYQDCPVTPLQYIFLPVMLVLITIVVGVPLYLVVHHFGQAWSLHWLTKPGIQHNFVQRLYTGAEVYEGLVIGLIVGVVAGRTYRAYLYANTMNYGRTWVAKGRKARWWMPYPTRNLIADLCEQGQEHQREVLAERHSSAAVVAEVGVLVAIGLAIYGWYILEVIA